MTDKLVKDMSDEEKEQARYDALSPAMQSLDDDLKLKVGEIDTARDSLKTLNDAEDKDDTAIDLAKSEISNLLGEKKLILKEIDDLDNEEFLDSDEGIAFTDWLSNHKRFKKLEDSTKEDNTSSLRKAMRYQTLADKYEEQGDDIAKSVGSFMSGLEFKDDEAKDSFRDKINKLAGKIVRESAKDVRKKAQTNKHKSNAIYLELLDMED